MRKGQLTELRNDLNAVARQLAASGNGATAREIVEAFHKERPALIHAASRFLIDTALTRLVGDVIKRRADKNIDIEQSELFERTIADIIAVSSSATGAGRRDHYRVVGSLPVNLAVQMVKHHLETRRRKKDRFDTYKEVLDFISPYVTSDEMTVNEALAAARAQGVKRPGQQP
jgi:hypothetical protein